MLMLVVYAVLFFAAVYLVIGVGWLIMAWFDSDPHPAYDLEDYLLQRERDLQDAYYTLEQEFGRPPTSREIWELTPPRMIS